MDKLNFASDYTQGAHPAIIRALTETNMEFTPGYGTDEICERARDRIRLACGAPEAEVWFLSGGTQTNMTVLDAILQKYEGVISAETGHVSAHEAGAIEFTGHKVLPLPQERGKLSPDDMQRYLQSFFSDENRDHMVMPGMVYLSQPTEYGTLYSLEELRRIRALCDEFSLKLYVDGARLAYALASPENDVSLADLAALCDVFYIGGTKCGAMFGEAVVLPRGETIPHFLTIIKQHGALLAKGWMLGLQFDALFTDGLYERIGAHAIQTASMLQALFLQKGYPLLFRSPTNQIFVVLENERLAALAEYVSFSFWERLDEGHTVVRFATSWATREEDLRQLAELL